MLSSPELPAVLQRVLSDRPDRESVTHLVVWMQHVAVSYLRMRRSRSGERLLRVGLVDRDVALECVAEMFERDARGRFARLARQFEGLDAASDGPEVWMRWSRALVMRCVDDGLYRMAREDDPGLSRLLRTLRTAAAARPELELERRHGHAWIRLAQAQAGRALPVMPDELFRRRLLLHGSARNADALLDAAVRVFHAASSFEPAIPLVSLALVLREAMVREAGSPAPVEFPDDESSLDLRSLAGRAARTVERSLPSDGAQGDGSHHVSVYLSAAQDVIVEEYTGWGPAPHHEVLARYVPDLTREEFRRHHRNRFEYLVKRIRAAFLELLRDDFRSATLRERREES